MADRESYLNGPLGESSGRGALAPLKHSRGPCPGGDRLFAYHKGELAATDADCIARHVTACGFCEGFLALLTQDADPASMPHAQLDEAEARIGARIRKASFSASLTTKSRLSLREWLWRPQPAYALALFAMGISVLALRSIHPKEAKVSQSFGAIQGISLDLTRGATEDAVLSIRGDSFFLAFRVPVSEGDSWSAEVVDSQRRSVLRFAAISSADSLGNFVLVLPANRFTRGNYTLKLEKASPGSSSREAFELPFRIR